VVLQKETIDALLGLSIYGPRNAAIKDHVRKLHGRFARYDLPIEEVRQLVDESLGDHTLTGQLRRIREG
jgi:hypothetical protein